jgi:hypothetical protein
VRLEGAPFVERVAFDPADLTAFTFAHDGGAGDAAAWSVDPTGVVRVADGSGPRFAIFGEPTWNHFSVTVSVGLSGAAAGVAIALPASGPPSSGLLALQL